MVILFKWRYKLILVSLASSLVTYYELGKKALQYFLLDYFSGLERKSDHSSLFHQDNTIHGLSEYRVWFEDN